jgi:hypothetical protein
MVLYLVYLRRPPHFVQVLIRTIPRPSVYIYIYPLLRTSPRQPILPLLHLVIIYTHTSVHPVCIFSLFCTSFCIYTESPSHQRVKMRWFRLCCSAATPAESRRHGAASALASDTSAAPWRPAIPRAGQAECTGRSAQWVEAAVNVSMEPFLGHRVLVQVVGSGHCFNMAAAVHGGCRPQRP